MLNPKGKIKAQGLIIIIMFIIVGTTIGILGWWYRNNFEPTFERIIITSDEDFSSIYGLPGIGTKDDPYRIEKIHLKGTHRIEISDTTKYFVIQNCELKNLWGETIIIRDIADGSAMIRNNTFIEDEYLFHYFIRLLFTTNCSIIDNNFINDVGHLGMNGIFLLHSFQTNITDNYFLNMEYSITIDNSHLSKVTRNRFETNRLDTTDYSIRVTSSDYVSIVENTMKNVYVGINCAEANNLIILNNSMNFCNYSIGLYRTSYCLVSENIINNSYRLGFSIVSTDYCVINNNTIRNCDSDVIALDNCQYNNLTCNSFLNNEEHAISFSDCYNNTLWNNNFLENNPNGNIIGIEIYYKQAFDDGINSWYNTNLALGNYWSDLSWNLTASYPIDYGINFDLYPLEFPIL